jgi:hypothetical protein
MLDLGNVRWDLARGIDGRVSEHGLDLGRAGSFFILSAAVN